MEPPGFDPTPALSKSIFSKIPGIGAFQGAKAPPDGGAPGAVDTSPFTCNRSAPEPASPRAHRPRRRHAAYHAPRPSGPSSAPSRAGACGLRSPDSEVRRLQIPSGVVRPRRVGAGAWPVCRCWLALEKRFLPHSRAGDRNRCLRSRRLDVLCFARPRSLVYMPRHQRGSSDRARLETLLEEVEGGLRNVAEQRLVPFFVEARQVE